MEIFGQISGIRRKVSTITSAIPQMLQAQWNMCLLYAVLLPLMDLLSAYWMYLVVLALQGRDVKVAGFAIYSSGHSSMIGLVIGFVVLSAIRQGVNYGSVSTSRQFTQNIYKHYSVRLITTYLSLPWLSFVGDTRSAKIKHCTNTTLNAAFSFQVVLNFIGSLATLLLLGAATFIKVPLLAITALVSLITVSTVIKRMIAAKMKAAVQSHELYQKVYYQKLHEVFNLPREINLFGVKQYFLSSLEDLLHKLSKAKTDLSIYPQIPKIAIELVLTVALIIGLVVTMMSGSYSPAELIANTATVALLARRIIPSMSDFLSSYTELYGSMININIINEELTEVHKSGEHIKKDILGNAALLKMENIGFAYDGSERILSNANLHIDKSDRIMLHGRTGKGKSTMLMIAAGIIDPSEGTIILNEKAQPRNLSFAYVAQETVLMRSSILENIVFGNHEIDHERVRHVLKLVNLDMHVQSLPQDIHTEIGDNGVTFSGGQRQRLGIARALYSQPGILFLDEATSALDEETEHTVMHNINEFMQDGAVLFITHRTSVGQKFANKTLSL